MTNLAESGGLSVGRSIGEWVLVEAGSVAIPGDDDDTKHF